MVGRRLPFEMAPFFGGHVSFSGVEHLVLFFFLGETNCLDVAFWPKTAHFQL